MDLIFKKLKISRGLANSTTTPPPAPKKPMNFLTLKLHLCSVENDPTPAKQVDIILGGSKLYPNSVNSIIVYQYRIDTDLKAPLDGVNNAITF